MIKSGRKVLVIVHNRREIVNLNDADHISRENVKWLLFNTYHRPLQDMFSIMLTRTNAFLLTPAVIAAVIDNAEAVGKCTFLKVYQPLHAAFL